MSREHSGEIFLFRRLLLKIIDGQRYVLCQGMGVSKLFGHIFFSVLRLISTKYHINMISERINQTIPISREFFSH